MNQTPKLELEVLNGPLDGHVISLEANADWTAAPSSSLSFPWDAELGQPQARFILEADGWRLQPSEAKRGTHILRQDAEDRLPVTLQADDVLKASSTWLKVR